MNCRVCRIIYERKRKCELKNPCDCERAHWKFFTRKSAYRTRNLSMSGHVTFADYLVVSTASDFRLWGFELRADEWTYSKKSEVSYLQMYLAVIVDFGTIWIWLIENFCFQETFDKENFKANNLQLRCHHTQSSSSNWAKKALKSFLRKQTKSNKRQQQFKEQLWKEKVALEHLNHQISIWTLLSVYDRLIFSPKQQQQHRVWGR